MHLVGFIVRINYDARSSERQMSFNSIHTIKIVLDCKMMYILLIIENTMAMPQLKKVAHSCKIILRIQVI